MTSPQILKSCWPLVRCRQGRVGGGCQEHQVSVGYLAGVRDDVPHRQLSLAPQDTGVCVECVCVCAHVCVGLYWRVDKVWVCDVWSVFTVWSV